MSTPKVIRAAQKILQQLGRLTHGFTKALVGWLLRSLLIIGRQPLSKAGFVLPTTVLLILVIVLTVGAISYRTFTRTQQAITGRQQQVVYNAATPVIDRAKSKIEFLFDPEKDTRGGGIPSQTQLLGMMLNDGTTVPTVPKFSGGADPYTFQGAGEERIDINGDGVKDNAWRYRVDLDGDGNVNSAGKKDGWAVYSIIFTAPNNPTALQDARQQGWQQRANGLLVRTAPLSNSGQVNNACLRNEADNKTQILLNEDGWFADPNQRTKIRKNFQVDAYVVPDNPTGTIATLEFQQDREATAGFKWAAWFRNDLEIFPGPAFNWNGAMHTEGNLIVGGNSSFRGYLVSSPNSCINGDDASEITVKENEIDKPIKGTPEFKGRFIAGTIRDNNFSGVPKFDIAAKTPRDMGAGQDSLNPGSLKPIDFSLEPVTLQTKGLSEARNPAADPKKYEDTAWLNGPLNDKGDGRLTNIKDIVAPYVDDTFRADNRWGPKPTWGRKGLPIGVVNEDSAGGGSTVKIGEPITGIAELTGSDPKPGEDTSSVGLDGYWERRARVEGLRLIVGQRLELGDPAGWGGPGGNAGGGASAIDLNNEPLKPWLDGCTAGTRCNEERQRRALWDNLAAIQATAVYHNATDTTADQRDFPDACLITTVHPGTPTTLDRSSTFEKVAFGLPPGTIAGYSDAELITDIFRGRGTNGWEFAPPASTDFKNINSPLMNALRNLAYFAGDPNGGAPSFTPIQVAGKQVHPYPAMATFGDFSMLRQVFRLLDGGTSYDKLSPADKTTLHTAGCTLGMLAYNVDYLEKLKVYGSVGVDGKVVPDTDPTRLKADGVTPLNPQLKLLAGYTDAEINSAGLTLNAGTIGDDRYSAGLRGRIRVIDHLVLGFLTDINQLPANRRPPQSLVDLLTQKTGLDTDNSMPLSVWNPRESSNPETYVRLLERWRDGLPATPATAKDEMNAIISLAQLIVTKEQVARDRTWGFTGTYGQQAYGAGNPERFVSTAPLGDCGYLENNNRKVDGWLTETQLPLKDPATGKDLNKDISPNYPTLKQPDPLARLCPYRPRYPVLYSLFPAKMPNALTPPATLAAAYGGGFIAHGDVDDPTESRFVRDFQDSLPKIAGYIRTENSGYNYQVIPPASIALRPSRLTQSGVTLGGSKDWVLPFAAGNPSVGATPNNNQYNLIKICSGHCSEANNPNSSSYQLPKTGTLVRVAFKDTTLFNGRELMPVRALNLDLRLMADSKYGSDLWLPKQGIIYAYREDAVSESHIVRPNTGNTWEQCDTDTELGSAACNMQTADPSAYDSKDPPLNDKNSITPKPVDYYPDPDRRPNGFRMIQGSNIKRDGDEGRGVSLISDNPVYLQGDFNLHQTDGGQLLEEFTQPLADNYSNFYDRSDLDISFADRNKDQWRPSEIIADAVTLLSSNFCDGSIEDGFANIGSSDLPNWLQNRYGCTGNGKQTSFHNQNRPKDVIINDATTQRGVLWSRANMIDSLPRAMRTTLLSGHNPDEGESPIFIARNGQPVLWKDLSGAADYYNKTYVLTKDASGGKTLIKAPSTTRMNMIMVSGLVPSREGQSYGGLHNFPRFLESWSGKKLYISGAFLQLNFSTYATAPFDQEAWQPGAPAPITGANSNEWIQYYDPPDRRWGYDVGLQYSPAGPVAQRFKFAEDIRSEFYSEPPANDPYIRNLCLQVPGNTAAKCPT